MSRFLLISAGAVAGANARYWLSTVFARLGPAAFPWSTLTINLSGSLLLGAFLGYMGTRAVQSTAATMLVAVGFCGAYTTFSTFGYEVFSLLQERALLTAASYVATSVGIGLVAVVAGWYAGTALGGG